MRAYFFCNFYLSSIQNGIQAGHCLGDMVVKYLEPSYQKELFMTFLKEHKTWIVLNGGAQKALGELLNFFRDGVKAGFNEFPYTSFREEEDALNGALTCVGIIVPSRIYEFAELLRNDITGTLKWNMDEQFSRRGFACFDLEKMGNSNYTLNNHWEYDLALLLNTYSLAK